LSFQTGGKMTVPFEAFLIFSTNLRPDNLGDEAFLRRIQYKMFLRSPNPNEYMMIFERYAHSKQLEFTSDLVRQFVEKHYVQGGKRYRRCHPRDIISHAIDIINFESLPKKLTEDLLDHAFTSAFVENIDPND
jgi:SpoVK/Ycf46/Vps4 family AAA+-type ATPase